MHKTSVIACLALSLVLNFFPLQETYAFRLQRTDSATPYNSGEQLPSQRPPFDHWDLRDFADCKVRYTINVAGTPDIADNGSGAGGEFDAIDSSFASWENVKPSVIRFTRTPTTTTIAKIAPDNKNVLLWDEDIVSTDPWSALMGTDDAAITANFMDVKTGRILDADILFNGENWLWSTTRQTITGEVTAGNAGPYALAVGQTLQVRVANGDTDTVTFQAADFADIGAATAQEVEAVLDSLLPGADADVVNGHVRLTASAVRAAIQVTGGTANGALGFDTNRYEGVGDVRTIATHEIGHFIGLHHSEDANALMDSDILAKGLYRQLRLDDSNGCNFLYTPDNGDAPDPPFPTRVQRNGEGAQHIFGYKAGNYQYEQIGSNIDDSPDECDALMPDLDKHDDGVTFDPDPPVWGENVVITVDIQTAVDAEGNSHDYSAPDGMPMYVNLWIDLNADSVWEEGDEHPINNKEIRNAQKVPSTPVKLPDSQCTIWLRARLDWGEKVSHPPGTDPTLQLVKGAAQFGEVEDYLLIGVKKDSISIEKTHNTIQGTHELVHVTLEDGTEKMGGFDFLIAYDASALTFQAAIAGPPFYDPAPDGCAWEYFTYRYGPFGNCGDACPSGLLRIIAIAETNNGPYHPSCFIPDSLPATLFTLDFLVTDDRTFECTYVPIRFFWMDCGDNAISSKTGDTLYVSDHVYDFEGTDITDLTYGFPTYFGIQEECFDSSQWYIDPETGDTVYKVPQPFIDLINGGIDIVCAESLDARGDVNLNGVSNEVADAVLFSNYFIYGLGVFHINFDGQVAATDVNADGMVLTVGDLVYQIRIIVGDAPPYPKLAPVVATYAVDNGVVSVDAEMGAAYVVAEGDVTPTLLADNMEMKYNYDADENVTRILVYSMEKGQTFAGAFLDVESKVVSIEMATYEGAPVTSTLLPTEFALHQNFPNPFNPITTISFALPVATDYELAIYNVMGQEVATFTGHSEPGIVKVDWDASNYASGVYLYKLTAGNFTDTKKMVLLK